MSNFIASAEDPAGEDSSHELLAEVGAYTPMKHPPTSTF